jgi:hypothetical protein
MARFPTVLLAALLLGPAIPAARGQTPSSAPSVGPVSLADRAGDDALQRLFDTIAALPVVCDGENRTVSSLLATAPAAERRFRQVILEQRKLGRARDAGPGLTAIDGWIAAEPLRQALVEAITAARGGQAPRELTFAPGTGTITATGQIADDGTERSDRPGWRQCTSADLDMVRGAAERDLRRRLLAWCSRIIMVNHQTIGLMARQKPELDRALRAEMDRVTGGEPLFEPAGVCVISCTLSSDQVSSLLGRAFSAAGLAFQGEFRPATPLERLLLLDGYSVAPPRSPAIPASRPSAIAAGPRPDWADQALSKTASASAPGEDSPARRELAIQAARIEARRLLWLDLEKLALPDGRTLAEAVAARPDRDRVIAAIDAAVFEMAKPTVTSDGQAEITLGVKLNSVWKAMAR